jgi:hypothetical protein
LLGVADPSADPALARALGEYRSHAPGIIDQRSTLSPLEAFNAQDSRVYTMQTIDLYA